MSDVEVMPELKQIVGAMLFAAKSPLSLAEIRKVLVQTGEVYGGPYKEFATLKEPDIAAAMQQLATDLITARAGVHVSEVVSGFRLNNDAGCGPWLRILLDKGRAQRLSKPALETLAIIAYRQPVTRGEIEGVRGVAVDAIIRNLMELQLIKIVGRSELPGRPWLFGTTQKFLESFGLKNMEDLPSIQELKRIQAEQEEREIAAAAERAAAETQQQQITLNEKMDADSKPTSETTTEQPSAEEADMGVKREDIDRDYDGEREEDFEEEDEKEEKDEDLEEEDDEIKKKVVPKVADKKKDSKDEEKEDEEEADEEEDEDEYDDDDDDEDEEDEDDEEEEDDEDEDKPKNSDGKKK